ncbi:hypothetical protein KCU73_g145, partial [Aureobasidium melanogenum]
MAVRRIFSRSLSTKALCLRIERVVGAISDLYGERRTTTQASKLRAWHDLSCESRILLNSLKNCFEQQQFAFRICFVQDVPSFCHPGQSSLLGSRSARLPKIASFVSGIITAAAGGRFSVSSTAVCDDPELEGRAPPDGTRLNWRTVEAPFPNDISSPKGCFAWTE